MSPGCIGVRSDSFVKSFEKRKNLIITIKKKKKFLEEIWKTGKREKVK